MQSTTRLDSHPTASTVTTPLKDIQKALPLRVLSLADWRHWTTSGYVIVQHAVPRLTLSASWMCSGSSTRRITGSVDLVRAAAARPRDGGVERHRYAGDLQPPGALGQSHGAARL